MKRALWSVFAYFTASWVGAVVWVSTSLLVALVAGNLRLATSVWRNIADLFLTTMLVTAWISAFALPFTFAAVFALRRLNATGAWSYAAAGVIVGILATVAFFLTISSWRHGIDIAGDVLIITVPAGVIAALTYRWVAGGHRSLVRRT